MVSNANDYGGGWDARDPTVDKIPCAVYSLPANVGSLITVGFEPELAQQVVKKIFDFSPEQQLPVFDDKEKAFAKHLLFKLQDHSLLKAIGLRN